MGYKRPIKFINSVIQIKPSELARLLLNAMKACGHILLTPCWYHLYHLVAQLDGPSFLYSSQILSSEVWHWWKLHRASGKNYMYQHQRLQQLLRTDLIIKFVGTRIWKISLKISRCLWLKSYPKFIKSIWFANATSKDYWWIFYSPNRQVDLWHQKSQPGSGRVYHYAVCSSSTGKSEYCE